MIGYPEAPEAWALLHRVAIRSGFDIARAVLDGWLTRAELAELVSKCQGGGCASGCADILAAASTSHPPVFCAVKAELLPFFPDKPA